MMLKAACVSNPGYVDRLIIPFVRVIQRMAREHLNATTNADVTPGNDYIQVGYLCTPDVAILSL